jgi:hypothetical protein
VYSSIRLRWTTRIEIEMPRGAHVLCVQVQHGSPKIWALIDEDAPMENRRFALRGTGHAAEGLTVLGYIGTFQMHNGNLVFHLFSRD